jgi:hypothetical protein
MTTTTQNQQAQHTPGPWEANGSRVDVPPAYPVPLIIATCSITHDGGQDAANARLIAAAPELLEASKLATQSLSNNGTWLPDEYADAFRALNQAIAKATVGQP